MSYSFEGTEMTTRMRHSALTRRLWNNAGGTPSVSSARGWRKVSVVATKNSPTFTASNAATSSHFYSTTPAAYLGAEKETNIQPWRDPAMRQYMFWNREEHSKEQGKYQYLIEFSPESVRTEAKILSLSTPDDEANQALYNGPLPVGAKLLGMGTTVDDFVQFEQQNPNVLFVSPSCPHAAEVLPAVLNAFPSIQWVHVRSAGIDFVESEELIGICNNARPDLRVTNAKGQFSSSLAEYVIMACSYFAKDLPRLMAQQKNKQWVKYNVEELRGKTLGIIGYGEYSTSNKSKCTVVYMHLAKLRHVYSVAIHRIPTSSDLHCRCFQAILAVLWPSWDRSLVCGSLRFDDIHISVDPMTRIVIPFTTDRLNPEIVS